MISDFFSKPGSASSALSSTAGSEEGSIQHELELELASWSGALMPARLVFVGDGRVGASALIRRFTAGNYTDDYRPEIAKVMRHTKELYSSLVEDEVTVQFWDVEGGDFQTGLYCASKAHAVAVIYDITNRSSFEKAQMLLEGINPRASALLIGNKVDLEVNLRKVSFKEGRLLAKIHKVQFLEISVKENYNVEEVFKIMVASVPEEYLKTKGHSKAERRWKVTTSVVLCAVCSTRVKSHHHQRSRPSSESGIVRDQHNQRNNELRRHPDKSATRRPMSEPLGRYDEVDPDYEVMKMYWRNGRSPKRSPQDEIIDSDVSRTGSVATSRYSHEGRGPHHGSPQMQHPGELSPYRGGSSSSYGASNSSYSGGSPRDSRMYDVDDVDHTDRYNENHHNTHVVHSNGGHPHSNAGHVHSNGGHAHSNGGHPHSNGGHPHSNGGHPHSNGGHAHSNGAHSHGHCNDSPHHHHPSRGSPPPRVQRSHSKDHNRPRSHHQHPQAGRQPLEDGVRRPWEGSEGARHRREGSDGGRSSQVSWEDEQEYMGRGKSGARRSPVPIPRR